MQLFHSPFHLSNHFKTFACVFIATLLGSGSQVAQAKDTLILGIHPYVSAQEVVKKFTPLANYLTKTLHKTVEIQVAKDYATHIEAVSKDQPDIAYMGPSSYVELLETHNNPLLARLEINGKPTFRGALIMGPQNHFKTLEELKGKSFAFGSPHSTMSHLVPRYMLHQAGIDVDRLSKHEFLGNHESVALSVLMGEFDVGAVKEEIYFKFQERGLQLLQWTPEISEHVFVASKQLPETEVQAMREALYAIGNTPEGLLVLQSIQKDVTGLVPAKVEDYANLKEILDSLKQRGIAEQAH